MKYQLVLSKFGMFLAYFINGTYWAFMNVFLYSVGLPIDKIGLISGIRLIFTLLGNIITYFGESDRKKIFVLIILVTGLTLAVFPSPWVAQLICPKKNVCFQSGNYTSYTNATANGAMKCELMESSCDEALFYVMLTLFCSSAVFEWSLISFVETLVVNIASKYNVSFGIERIFAEIGYAIGVLVCGTAAQYIQIGEFSPYTIVYIIYLIAIIILFIVSLLLIKDYKGTKRNKSKNEESLVKENANGKERKYILKMALLKVDVLIVFLMVTFGGVSNSIINGYLFLFIERELKESTMAMSYVYLAPLLESFLILVFSDKLIKILGGTFQSLTFAMFCFGLRFLLFWFSTSIWWIYAAQSLLHSPSILFLIITVIGYLSKEMPHEIIFTVFGLYNTWSYGGCFFIGNIIGGYIGHKFSLRLLMLFTAIFSFTGSAIGASYVLIRRKRYLRKQGSDGVEIANEKKCCIDNLSSKSKL